MTSARYRVEREHVSKMGTVAWLLFAGPFDTRTEAEVCIRRAEAQGGRQLRIVEVPA